MLTEDPKKDLDQVIGMIEQAPGGRTPCDIICFPEMALGSLYRVPAGYFQAVHDAVKRAGVWCVMGSYQRFNERVYNKAFLFNPEGGLARTYAKCHLGPDENGVTAGNEGPFVAATTVGRIGVVLSQDIADPFIMTNLARHQPQVIIAPCFWSWQVGNHASLMHLVGAHAVMQKAFVVAVDAGHRRTTSSIHVAAPWGPITSYAKPEFWSEKRIIREVFDLERLEESRKVFDCR